MLSRRAHRLTLDLWLAKDNRFLNPKSSYERILSAPPCRLILSLHSFRAVAWQENNFINFIIPQISSRDFYWRELHPQAETRDVFSREIAVPSLEERTVSTRQRFHKDNFRHLPRFPDFFVTFRILSSWKCTSDLAFIRMIPTAGPQTGSYRRSTVGIAITR